MIFYAGDTHGNVLAIGAIDRAARKAGCEIVVQVGDFGLLFAGDREKCPVINYFSKRESGPTWYTCGGNHDNWPLWNAMDSTDGVTELAKDCFYVHRAQSIELDGKRHLFFGGAESTDKHHRIEGVSWWKEETPTAAEFSRFFDAIENYKPEVVVTHDAPLAVDIWKYDRNTNPTPRNLENIFNQANHKPELWMFGHHHTASLFEAKGVKFYCCGFEGDYIKVDI